MTSASLRWEVPSGMSVGPLLPALGKQSANTLPETAQAHLGGPQGAARIGARIHARLHPLDERLVFQVDLPVDTPVQIARRAHLAPLVGVDVGNLTYQGLGRRDRNELHEVDLIRIDVEGQIGP